MLNLLEGPLQHAGFQYRRLDGTMTVQARDRAISDFTKRPEVRRSSCFGRFSFRFAIGKVFGSLKLKVISLKKKTELIQGEES